MTPFSCRPCAFFIDPCYCCGSPLLLVFAPLHSLPIPADFNCAGALPGCLYCTWRYSWDQNSQGSSAGWSKSHVCAVAPSTAGGIGPATQPTAWFQSPQACGARLSEREQMVTWIVQQVPSTPAHCLACSTLPQQTLLIIDVLEWPHHHWILQSGRIIKVITATLTYLLYCNSGSGISSRGVDSLKLLGNHYTHTGFYSIFLCVYSTGVEDGGYIFLTWLIVGVVSYLIRATFLYHIFSPYHFHHCERFKNTF